MSVSGSPLPPPSEGGSDAPVDPSVVPHERSAERLRRGAHELELLATAYLDTDAADLAPEDRTRLWEAAELLDLALERFQ